MQIEQANMVECDNVPAAPPAVSRRARQTDRTRRNGPGAPRHSGMGGPALAAGVALLLAGGGVRAQGDGLELLLRDGTVLAVRALHDFWIGLQV